MEELRVLVRRLIGVVNAADASTVSNSVARCSDKEISSCDVDGFDNVNGDASFEEASERQLDRVERRLVAVADELPRAAAASTAGVGRRMR